MDKLIEWHSHDRISDYKNYVKEPKNKEQIKNLYILNQQFYIFFYPLLANFELLLRNKVSNYLEVHKQHAYWYEDILLNNNYNPETKHNIEKLIKKIQEKKSTHAVSSLLTSRLGFGFWKTIIEKHPKKLDLHQYLNITNNHIKQIRVILDLRNRCFHFENIIKDPKILQDTYSKLINLISLIGGQGYKIQVFQIIENLFNNKNLYVKDIFSDLLKQLEALHNKANKKA